MNVLVITDKASLRVALSLMTGDWDVAIAAGLEEAAMASGPFDAVVVDVGTTEEGIAALAALDSAKSSLPTVYIGDEQRTPEGRKRFMSRPFSVDVLMSEVEQAANGANAWRALGPTITPPHHEPSLRTGTPMTANPPSESAEEPRRPRTVEPSAPRPRLASVAETLIPEKQFDELRSRVARFREREPKSNEQFERESSKPELHSRAETREKVEKRGPSRLRLAQREPVETSPKTLVGRLTRAVGVLKDIELLIDDYPIMSDWRGMSQAFLDEVLERFAPETASLLIQGDDGRLYPAVSFGLSIAESAMKVSTDHPLMKEVAGNLKSILIVPVHLAHGMVAGVGGAHTEAFMVSPLQVEGVCYGICAVGAASFTEKDLARLEALAAEAAPGLAMGLLLERSRKRLLVQSAG